MVVSTVEAVPVALVQDLVVAMVEALVAFMEALVAFMEALVALMEVLVVALLEATVLPVPVLIQEQTVMLGAMMVIPQVVAKVLHLPDKEAMEAMEEQGVEVVVLAIQD